MNYTGQALNAEGDHLIDMPYEFTSKKRAVAWCREAARDRSRWVRHAESESFADSITHFAYFKEGEKQPEDTFKANWGKS